jgi:hypothetical protein
MPEIISTSIPGFIKPLLRFLRYRNERKKFIREIAIRKEQDRQLKLQYDAAAKKLIIFAIPGSDRATGKDTISGGIISIVSLCEETVRLQEIHGAATILCTLPGQHLLLKHTQFDNTSPVFRLGQTATFFTLAEEVILHLPEFACKYFLEHIGHREMEWLKTRKRLHINILNQNILLMPGDDIIQQLKKIASSITITTAHQNYCTMAYRQQYGVPLHKLSVWISPEKYRFTAYEQKENLIVISPDEHPLKQQVLEKLQKLSGLRCQVIQNLTYGQYKETIARAKWTLTFGEGLDGYLIEPVFSGALAFAVYNKDFFTSDFETIPTLYASYEVMLNRITDDITSLDNAVAFNKQQQKQFELCARYYSEVTYRDNLAKFYRQQYTLP